MAATRSPTTKLIMLAAIILAAGLFCLRAVEVFSAPDAAEPTGSPLEQKLTGLIAPIAGNAQFRVSVHYGEDGGRSFLIMLNETAAAEAETSQLHTVIENLLIAGAGMKPGLDQLTFVDVPFASSGVFPGGSEIIELAGLGLLAGLILIGLVSSAGQAGNNREDRAQKAEPADPAITSQPETTARPAATVSASSGISGISGPSADAVRLAAQDPDGTVTLIRKWMTADKDAGTAQ